MKTLSKGKIIIISGPSGSGKTTLHKKLLLSDPLKGKITKSISATTRPKRSDEQDGRDYLFMTVDEFLKKIKTDYFLEWQKVFDNYYGTPKSTVEELLNSGHNVLLCIDVKGAAVVQQLFPDSIKIFVKVQSLDVLKERLIARGTESAKDLKIRLETAKDELKEESKYDHVLINDHLEETFSKLEETVLGSLKSRSK